MNRRGTMEYYRRGIFSSINMDELIDALFSESKIFKKIKWGFLLISVGIMLGYAWAYIIFH